LRDVEVFADEIFGFHVQQAAEKLFKAWIALLGEEYPSLTTWSACWNPSKNKALL
jgi:HEPN domain-containing protein